MKTTAKILVALTCWTSMGIFAFIVVIYCLARNFVKYLSTPPSSSLIQIQVSSPEKVYEIEQKWSSPLEPCKPYSKHHPAYQSYSN